MGKFFKSMGQASVRVILGRERSCMMLEPQTREAVPLFQLLLENQLSRKGQGGEGTSVY